MVRIHRLLYTSVEIFIHRLLKCVKTFGRTPVPLPKVRDEISNIRLNRPCFHRGRVFITRYGYVKSLTVERLLPIKTSAMKLS